MDNLNEINSLLRSGGFDDLVPGDLHAHMRVERFEKGKHLIRTGTGISRLYFHVSGRSKVYKELANGHVAAFRFYCGGNVIGDVEFFSGEYTTASIIAVSTVTCVTVPFEVLRKNLHRLPDLLMFMGKCVSGKMKSNSVIMAINSFYKLEDRISMFLAYADDSANSMKFRNLSFETYQEFSELLGTSYRNLSRVLKKLEAQGRISRENRKIRVLSRDWLMDVNEYEMY